jgi:hypothetical protein
MVLLTSALAIPAALPACGGATADSNVPGKSSCEQQCESIAMGCESSCTQWNERVCMQGCDNRRATCLARCQ